MSKSMFDRIRDERGVALVTVLLIGASLTALASAAAFTTIREFRSGGDDRRAAAALSYAESGVDRFMQQIKSGVINYNNLYRAGCEDPALSVPTGELGLGTFEATLTVFDPDAANPADRMPPTACSTRVANPRDGRAFFQITSTGRYPEAKRVIRQVILVEPIGLPIGLYGNSFDVNGNPDTFSISLISEGAVYGREKLHFNGLDPYYTYGDFFPGGVNGHDADDPVPAAAHAAGGLYLKNNGDAEFPPAPNCGANKDGGTQSLWDSDGSSGAGALSAGCAGQTGYPLSNVFTTAQAQSMVTKLSEADLEGLRQAARNTGIYCSLPGQGGTGGTQCYLKGVGPSAGFGGMVASLLGGTPPTNNFVAYFDFRSGTPLQNNLTWTDSVWGCNLDPALNKSVVIIVDNGGFNMSGNGQVNGAVIVDGAFDWTGTPQFHGTIIASDFRMRGNADFSLDDCWTQNMPGPFLRAVPQNWSEIDR